MHPLETASICHCSRGKLLKTPDPNSSKSRQDGARVADPRMTTPPVDTHCRISGKPFSTSSGLLMSSLELLEYTGNPSIVEFFVKAESSDLWYGYTKTRQARRNRLRRSQTKKWLLLSGFLHQKFAGTSKQVGQIVPDNTRFCLFL